MTQPSKKRILYIDYLKGLTILWVVWYHTAHPDFVNFSFRIPLFFFVSGIFFKPYPFKQFLRKKINTLLVPFVLFYAIYYIYYIMLWVSSGRQLATFDFASILSVFGLYGGSESFVINPPLWFIFALIDLQFLLYALVKSQLSRKWLALIAIGITLADAWWFYTVKTPFMISRCLRYFVYYAFGYLFGRGLISRIEGEHGRRASYLPGLMSLACFIACWFAKSITTMSPQIETVIDYVEVFSLILFMIYFLKYISVLPFLKFLKFYGQNSYIVLGMHEIILTLLLITYTRFVGQPDIAVGLGMLIVTALVLWPVILLFNHLCPKLVGKRELWTE